MTTVVDQEYVRTTPVPEVSVRTAVSQIDVLQGGTSLLSLNKPLSALG